MKKPAILGTLLAAVVALAVTLGSGLPSHDKAPANTPQTGLSSSICIGC
ncbi:hypothetical protein [Amycolatopsis sp. lyj-109]